MLICSHLDFFFHTSGQFPDSILKGFFVATVATWGHLGISVLSFLDFLLSRVDQSTVGPRCTIPSGNYLQSTLLCHIKLSNASIRDKQRWHRNLEDNFAPRVPDLYDLLANVFTVCELDPDISMIFLSWKCTAQGERAVLEERKKKGQGRIWLFSAKMNSKYNKSNMKVKWELNPCNDFLASLSIHSTAFYQ